MWLCLQERGLFGAFSINLSGEGLGRRVGEGKEEREKEGEAVLLWTTLSRVWKLQGADYSTYLLFPCPWKCRGLVTNLCPVEGIFSFSLPSWLLELPSIFQVLSNPQRELWGKGFPSTIPSSPGCGEDGGNGGTLTLAFKVSQPVWLFREEKLLWNWPFLQG